MRQTGVGKLVFSSSCAVYGVAGSAQIQEGDGKSPINPYGRTKLTVEHMIEDHCSLGDMGAVILRYFNAAGADPDGEVGEEHDPETHLIPLVLQAAAGTLPHATIYGDDFDTADGTCVRDYLHVSDIAAAHVAAIGKIRSGAAEPFNLGLGRGTSVKEIVEAAQRASGRKIAVKVGPRRAGDPPSLVANPAKALKELGWKPALTDVDDMIGTAWRWMVRNARPAGLYAPD